MQEDHVAKGLRIQRERLQAMGPAGRLRIASRLFHSARELKRAGLQQAHPEWSPSELERETSRIIAYVGHVSDDGNLG